MGHACIRLERGQERDLVYFPLFFFCHIFSLFVYFLTSRPPTLFVHSVGWFGFPFLSLALQYLRIAVDQDMANTA